MKTEIHCETLILGGSAFACGMASRNPENCLILERGILLIPEFASALHPIRVAGPRTQTGKQILRELERRGIVRGEKIHPPPLSDYFVHWMHQKKCRLLLNSELINLERSDTDVCAEIFCIDGLNLIRAERIIDTTAEGWRNRGRMFIRGKALCAAVCGTISRLPAEGELRCASFSTGILPGEHLLRVDVPADATWHEARLRLHDIFRRLQQHNPRLSLGGEATCMVYEYEDGGPIRRTMEDGILWIPSAQYQDPVTAFEEGLQWRSA